MDLGGHRFFSKSDRVMRWWLRFLPHRGRGARALRAGVPWPERATPRRRSGVGARPRARRTVSCSYRSRRSRILFGRQGLRLPASIEPRHAVEARGGANVRIGADATAIARVDPGASQGHPWRTSSSTASATSCTGRSFAPTPKESGVALCAEITARSGAPSASRELSIATRPAVTRFDVRVRGRTGDLAQQEPRDLPHRALPLPEARARAHCGRPSPARS